jgi:hypothetical protein
MTRTVEQWYARWRELRAIQGEERAMLVVVDEAQREALDEACETLLDPHESGGPDDIMFVGRAIDLIRRLRDAEGGGDE